MIKFKNRTGNCYVMDRVNAVTAGEDGYSWLILTNGNVEVRGTPEMVMKVLLMGDQLKPIWQTCKPPEYGVYLTYTGKSGPGSFDIVLWNGKWAKEIAYWSFIPDAP